MRVFSLPPVHSPTDWSLDLESRMVIVSLEPKSFLVQFWPFLLLFFLIFDLTNYWIMEPNWLEFDKEVTMISSLKRILCHNCRIFSALNTTTAVGNPQIAPQLLEAALQEVATPILRAENEDTFDGLINRTVLEKRFVSRIWPTQSCSWGRQENTVREQITNILTLVEDAIVWPFGDAGRPTKSSPDTKILPVLQTVFNRSVSEAF